MNAMIRIIPHNTHKENDNKNHKKYNQTKPKKSYYYYYFECDQQT